MATRRYSVAEEHGEIREQFDRWGTFLLANVLWAICSLPLVTLPAATAGLFAVMSARARGSSANFLPIFFGAARRLWWKATLLMLIDAAFGGWVALNLSILPAMGASNPAALFSMSVTLFAGIMLVLANLYAWSLLVLVDLPFKGLVSAAIQLVFSYPLWSLGVLIAAALPVGIGLILPQGVFVFAVASICAWIITAGTWRVIRKHVSEDALLSF